MDIQCPHCAETVVVKAFMFLSRTGVMSTLSGFGKDKDDALRNAKDRLRKDTFDPEDLAVISEGETLEAKAERERWLGPAKAASRELAYLMEQVNARPDGSVATAKADLDAIIHST